ADDVLGGLESRDDRSARSEAEAWLKDFLAAGPRPASEVSAESRKAGLAWATVRRAAQALNIGKGKSGFDSGWSWWPAEDAQPQHSRLSTFESTFERAIENKA